MVYINNLKKTNNNNILFRSNQFERTLALSYIGVRLMNVYKTVFIVSRLCKEIVSLLPKKKKEMDNESEKNKFENWSF